MWRLHHFPLCPFSRLVRLVLEEKGLRYDLAQVLPWQRDTSLLSLNPLAQTPVLHHRERGIVLTDSNAICEYLEETVPGARMMPGSAEQRAEIRRLMAWAAESVYANVTWPLLQVRVLRQPADVSTARDVRRHVAAVSDQLLDLLDYQLDSRAWLAGPTLSLADLAVAAHLSVADYLGGIDWRGHDQVQTWYSVLKSRRSFEPLLADTVTGVEPPRHYADVNA